MIRKYVYNSFEKGIGKRRFLKLWVYRWHEYAVGEDDFFGPGPRLNLRRGLGLEVGRRLYCWSFVTSDPFPAIPQLAVHAEVEREYEEIRRKAEKFEKRRAARAQAEAEEQPQETAEDDAEADAEAAPESETKPDDGGTT